ncbi:pitrilysin family protein [uncultured Sphingomonas sp.]|uniref:M16 family metallopeptidase n=1 Tax=uncultured Sphingomonas sp. TaxID=158754 RepID=UPI0025E02471|nr:pitrilysin family protein [uncultured Sphingomonas sp.]
MGGLITSPAQRVAVTQPPAKPSAAQRPAITDPITRFTLPNGLKVVVQTNKRVPLVTAALVYNVGSKDEKSGQHGYAHLFEHLMLDGSEHWNQNALKSLRDLGASDYNAATNQDTTRFYETFPTAALERVLFLEADRMGFIGAALTPERIKREVGVVLNEKRLRAAQPDGTTDAITFADLYPADHPYHHSTIGEEADLNAVTVDTARQWFDTYYGPSNVTLILAGDVTGEQARPLVEKYFGGLAPRLPLDRLLTRSVPLAGPVRREVYRTVPKGRIYATYIAPPQGSPDIASFDLTAQIVAAGTRSRLNRRLVEELGIATSAFVTFDEGRLSSRMGFVVDGIPADQMARAEAEIDAVIARYAAEGPTPDEVEAARASRIQYLMGLQATTAGKAFLLARAAGQTTDPDYAETYLRELRNATPESVREAVAPVYGSPGYRLIARPKPKLQSMSGGYNLTQGPPPMGTMAPIAFPAVEQTQLSNGLKVVLVPRAEAMTDVVRLRFDDAGLAGVSRDVAPVAFDLLTAKGATPDQRARAERAERLNGWIGSALDLDHSDVTMGWNAADLAGGVALLGDLLTKPDLTPETVAALKKARIDQLSAAQSNGNAMADRALYSALYGDGHPYARPLSSATDIAAVQAIDPAALREWYRGHVRPDHATLYVAARTDMATLRPLLEKALASWVARGPAVPAPIIPPARGTPTPSITIIDKPGASQTYILAGRILPRADRPDSFEATAAMAANEVYGGNSSARIASNLRVDKGWTYGIGSGLYNTRGERRWILAGTVDRDHSGDSVAELIREMRSLNSDRPPEQAELDRIVSAAANQNAAKLEGDGDLLAAMADAQSAKLPYDDVVRQPDRLRALKLDQLDAGAGPLANPDDVHWVLVGDWQRIRDQFAKLKLGTPVVVPLGR